MNSRVLASTLVFFSLSGCVLYPDGYGPGGRGGYPGNVQFTWSFAGQSCADVPQVRSVVVQIDGEVLENNGVYPCSVNGYPGILLHDFAPRTYRFTLTALDYSNQALFSAGGTFNVDGDVRVTVDLTPVGGGSSYAFLNWSFPPIQGSANPSCIDVGIAFVDVTIDSSTLRYDCSVGTTAAGARTDYFAEGVHNIRLVAVTSNNYPIYERTGTLTTYSGRPVAASYQLFWAVGGTSIAWQLYDSGLLQSCAQAGAQTVYVDFQDSSGRFVYGPTGDPQPCTGAPVAYNFLRPDTYRIYLRADGSFGRTYLSSTINPPLVTIVAGQFPSPGQAVTVALNRQ